MKRIVKFVKQGALIQGGAFRLDQGPTSTELKSFRYAVALYEECRKEGKKAALGCIINDLALPPAQRPKKTGQFNWPPEYLVLLQQAHIPLPEINTHYESTLRNQARKDLSAGRISVAAFTLNDTTQTLVATCPAIMGRYYTNLAEAGFSQQFGFYAQEPKACDDHSCPLGPLKGADSLQSGYPLGIEVLNYWVYPDDRLVVAGKFEPERKR